MLLRAWRFGGLGGKPAPMPALCDPPPHLQYTPNPIRTATGSATSAAMDAPSFTEVEAAFCWLLCVVASVTLSKITRAAQLPVVLTANASQVVSPRFTKPVSEVHESALQSKSHANTCVRGASVYRRDGLRATIRAGGSSA